MSEPKITLAVPSFNQGRYLDDALRSIFRQDIPVEVFVLDAGSTDNSLDIIHAWQDRLAGWRSHKDAGQAAAINEGIAQGSAPYVSWLNSDDWLLREGLQKLVDALESDTAAPAAYGRVLNHVQSSDKSYPVWTEPFNERRLALRCIVSQPGTLIRRTAWESVGGLDPDLHMAMDYDLWWRLFETFGPLHYLHEFIAVNRIHGQTKTNTQRSRHYREAIQVVKKHYGHVPLKWWLAQPYAVWFKALQARMRQD